MVSAGTVSSDLNSVTTSLTSYKSSIEGLSSSWTGPSFDNLNASVLLMFGFSASIYGIIMYS